MSPILATVAAVGAALLTGTGAWLIYTALTTGSGPIAVTGTRAAGTRAPEPGRKDLLTRWRDALGLGQVSVSEFAAAVMFVGAAGGIGAYLLFAGIVPAVVSAAFAATFPVAAYRRRRQLRAEAALSEWPRMLEEIRLRTGSLGKSIPQALFEVGLAAPREWRPAFEVAEREWLLSVDFARTVAVLKERLADATADVVCETLLMAHEIGGTDLDPKLAELIEDRTQDVQSRKDAASRLAGVRFARRFVLVVPLGMAAAGLTIGTGRHAYATAGGQVAVVAALAAVAACWWWAGRLMRLPGAPRVFR